VNDPRFIDEEEILSGLDDRTNLIDLTPHAFETVIKDLFQAMGVRYLSDTRLARRRC
jgi:restriction system protein